LNTKLYESEIKQDDKKINIIGKITNNVKTDRYDISDGGSQQE
jgi:hypothetical protein